MREKGGQISASQESKGRETDKELRLVFGDYNCTAWDVVDPVVQMGDGGGDCTELTYHLGETRRVGEQDHGTEPSSLPGVSSTPSLKSNKCRMLQNTQATENLDRPKYTVKKGMEGKRL